MKEAIGYTGVDLNAVFTCIRREETNIANFLADLANYLARSDVTIFNSGSLRIDEIIPEGVITIKEMRKLMPIYDPMVTLEGTGEQLLKLLENGVSKVPGYEGRFPCVSGVWFKYNPKLPEGSRIDPNDVTVNGKPLDKLKTYTITTKEYISHGKDGFNEFLNMKVIWDDEQTFDLCEAVIKIFRELQPESTFCSSPFVKQKSSDLMAAGLIVAAVRWQIIEAHKKLKLIWQ